MAARTERRIAAILAADVVGYSALMEQDEDRTLARLKAHRQELVEPLIGEYQGHVVKLMGDGLLAEFPSVVDAVRCAVLIQKGMAEREAAVPEAERIRLRIGINLGDVIREADGDLYGDGVNVAARLEQLADPGGVMISGTAYDQLHGKLDLTLDFAGEQRVKNIERLVRAYRVRLAGRSARRIWPRRWRRIMAPVAALLLLMLAAGGAWWLWPPEQAPTRPSIAVLPFENLGGDAETARLADGLTEDTITDLARFRDLEVIARNSTEAYKGRPVDVRQVGRELNVGYVLEGSIQRDAGRVRVTAQLIDTGSGAHVWSERWDRPAQDVFGVQSEIAEQITGKIGGFTGLIAAAGQEAAKRKRPEDLASYDLYLLGLEAQHRLTPEGVHQAIRLHKQSLAIDPRFARAWTALSWCYDTLLALPDPAPDLRQLSLDAARRAVELDPADAEAHAALGNMLGATGDLARAEAEHERALGLTPNSADILTIYAAWASSYGKPEKGVEAALRAIRLNPQLPAYAFRTYRYTFFMAGRYEDALHFANRVPREAYNLFDHVLRAAALAALGQDEEARAAVAETIAQFPDISVEGFAILDPAWNEAERQRLVETMRKAGFPSCASADDFRNSPNLPRLPECVAS